MADEYARGRLEEIDRRVSAISSRLDNHLSICVTRFLGILAIVLTFGGLIVAIVRG